MTRASDDTRESASLLTGDSAIVRVKKAAIDEWQLLGHDVLGRIFEFLGSPLSNPEDFNSVRRLNKLCLTIAHGVTKYPIPADKDRYSMSALLFLRKLYNAGFGTTDQTLRNDAYFSVPYRYTLTQLGIPSSNFHELLEAMNEKKEEYALLFGEQYNTLREKETFSFYCRYRMMQLSEYLPSTPDGIFFFIMFVISLMLSGYFIYLTVKKFDVLFDESADRHAPPGCMESEYFPTCKDFARVNLTQEIIDWLFCWEHTAAEMQAACLFLSKKCQGVYRATSETPSDVDYMGALNCWVGDLPWIPCWCAATGVEKAMAYIGPVVVSLLTFFILIWMLSKIRLLKQPEYQQTEHHVTSTLMSNLHRLFAHPNANNTTAVPIRREENRSDLES